jgi:hypothetical protein
MADDREELGGFEGAGWRNEDGTIEWATTAAGRHADREAAQTGPMVADAEMEIAIQHGEGAELRDERLAASIARQAERLGEDLAKKSAAIDEAATDADRDVVLGGPAVDAPLVSVDETPAGTGAALSAPADAPDPIVADSDFGATDPLVSVDESTAPMVVDDTAPEPDASVFVDDTPVVDTADGGPDGGDDSWFSE